MAKSKIGKLNQRVIVESQNDTRDAYGGFDDSWSTEFTVWAGMDSKFTSYVDENSQRKVITKHIFKMRYRTDFKPEYRFRIGTRVFEIESYYNDEQSDYYMYFECRELRR